MNLSKSQKIIFGILVFLFLVNFVLLDVKVFLKKEKEIVSSPEPAAATPTAIQQEAITYCPPACLDKIFEATTTAEAEVATKLPAPKEEKVVSQPAVKEFYIPFGSGVTKSNEWVELPGVEAVIDSANFPNVKSIIFEAALRVPSANGRVYAKLYDVTNKHDVWFSEVWAEGSTSYRAESANISLSPGRNLYRVMMKSTMAYEAILDLGRLKIVLE